MSKDGTNSQEQLAAKLADDLDCCGHDVTRADLLDCLASTGLVLAEGGEASDAYFRTLGATP